MPPQSWRTALRAPRKAPWPAASREEGMAVKLEKAGRKHVGVSLEVQEVSSSSSDEHVAYRG